MKQSLALLLLFSGSVAFAHGDSHGSEPAKKVTKSVGPTRMAAEKPGAIGPQMVQTILDGEKVPADVLLVRCNITESVPCRGLSISVSDSRGEKLATAHSGADGWVGFQGLLPSTAYELKIESSKYQANAMTSSGSIHRLSATRINQETK